VRVIDDILTVSGSGVHMSDHCAALSCGALVLAIMWTGLPARAQPHQERCVREVAGGIRVGFEDGKTWRIEAKDGTPLGKVVVFCPSFGSGELAGMGLATMKQFCVRQRVDFTGCTIVEVLPAH
jgi:hypothetical protein